MAKRLFWVLAFRNVVMLLSFEFIAALARPVGEMACDIDFNFIGGDSEVGVDSAELLIGDKEGMCDCVGMLKAKFGGGDGVTERDSAKRI